MSTPSDSWFVQMGFGAALGPMPTDALHEMARAGSLLPSDQVRIGSDGAWRNAAAVSGLFDAGTQTVAAGAAETDTDVGAAQFLEDGSFRLPPREGDPPAVPNRTVTPAPIVNPAPPPSPPHKSVPPPSPPREPAPLLTATRAARDVPARQKKVVASTAPAAISSPETHAPPVQDHAEAVPFGLRGAEADAPASAVIAAWKAQRHQITGDKDLLSLAENIRRDSDANIAKPGTAAPVPDEATSLADVPAEPRAVINRPPLLSQISLRRQKEETFSQKMERWKRSLPTWPVAIVVLLLLIGVWWIWPRSGKGIYHRYLAIWTDLQERRKSKSKEGWQEFLERSKAEVEASLPWLEANANSSNPKLQTLLWVGRDCLRKMLEPERARQIDSPEEIQFKGLLQTLKDFYDPVLTKPPDAENSSPETGGDSGTKSEADPEGPGT